MSPGELLNGKIDVVPISAAIIIGMEFILAVFLCLFGFRFFVGLLVGASKSESLSTACLTIEC